MQIQEGKVLCSNLLQQSQPISPISMAKSQGTVDQLEFVQEVYLLYFVLEFKVRSIIRCQPKMPNSDTHLASAQFPANYYQLNSILNSKLTEYCFILSNSMKPKYSFSVQDYHVSLLITSLVEQVVNCFADFNCEKSAINSLYLLLDLTFASHFNDTSASEHPPTILDKKELRYSLMSYSNSWALHGCCSPSSYLKHALFLVNQDDRHQTQSFICFVGHKPLQV